MKILFLVGASSRLRNFDYALLDLANRGHVLQVTGRSRGERKPFELPSRLEHPSISARVNPTQRSDAWADFVDLLRGARDYVRYLDPRYAQATRLVRRAYEIAPTEFVMFCEAHPWVKRHWRAAARVLAICEDLIPVDPGYEQFIRDERPDLILVTPLVTFESYQTDYVKAAHKLGIPVAFIPFSWDNLTNKGLMRVHPDRVLVWNDVQRTEAVDLHGSRPADVVVTGAARFDDFFNRTPSTTREEFFADYGLDPSRPMVLYLGSSQLTGPNEMELIRRWAESLRASPDETVRNCNILIRPHPALRRSWVSVDLSDLGRIGLSLDASRGADQELYDSLHHAHAAVGLNTSAMLEAAIVGRPVHTLMIPGFDEGQVGTMHFHYLVEAYGGLATIARTLDEHRQQLAGVFGGAPQASERSRSFAQHFLRPLGVDKPVSPILADEMERAGSITKRPRPSPPWWHAVLRPALLGWLSRRQTKQLQVAADASSPIATTMSLRPVRIALEEIQQSTLPVFVGPWNDSLANELLYWIPFVRWVSESYGIPRERLFVITRGGQTEWYASLAQRFLDMRTLFAASELEHWIGRTVPQREQDYKQAVQSPFDAEAIERAARAFDLSEYQVLHPLMLFRVLGRLEKDSVTSRTPEILRPRRLESAPAAADGLPRSFVAVSTAFTEWLPDNADNGAFLSQLLADLAGDNDIVLIDEPPPGVTVPVSSRVHRLQPSGDADLTRLQMAAFAKARAFAGSHGDLAVLAAFCGTPAMSYHTAKLPPDQVERLEAMAQSAGWGPVTVERARRFKGVRLPARVTA